MRMLDDLVESSALCEATCESGGNGRDAKSKNRRSNRRSQDLANDATPQHRTRTGVSHHRPDDPTNECMT